MSSPLSAALGWTLIHSLWQALLVYGTVTIVLRIIPSRRSSLRYAVTLGSLVVVLAASVVTFWWYSQTPAHAVYAVAADMNPADVAPDIAAPAPVSVWEQALTHVAVHMNLILAVWLAGALLFSLRMAGGVWYVTTLRRTSSPVGQGWQQQLETLAQRLDLQRVVTLATSVRLQAPVVLGYLKPVILIPAGMLAGLSPEQVETILLHELAHIRRHDYLVNLAQMLVEALYFFNPCIWALSAQVRTEREHCCDDAVVRYGGNARAYATALVQLEEVRLRQTGVALSLAENKHQLLTRIKRIMEKSVQQNPGRERLVPALLLVVGLVCAFWVTFGQNTAEAQQQEKKQDTPHEAAAGQSLAVTADTVSAYDRNGKRTHHYERHTTITIGDDGQPHEVTTETYDGDDDQPGMRYFSYTHPVPVGPVDVSVFGPGIPPAAFDYVAPVVEFVPPVVDVHIPDIPPMEPFVYEIPPIPDIIIDSIPPVRSYRTEADIEALQQAILDKLKGKFGDFYGEHEVELEKLMAEVQAEMVNAQASLRAVDAELHRDMMNRTRDHVYHDKVRWNAEHGKRMAELQRDMQSRRDAVRKHQEAVKIQQDIVREERAKVQVIHEELERYHTALRDHLVKDGYLKKNDDMFELHESDTEMTVNGKKVKEKDFAEYRKLRKQYVKEK